MIIIDQDTIAAISTPHGSAGIGKIRMSGIDALNIANKIFRGNHKKDLRHVENYTAHYGYVINPDTEKKADEVICIVMKEPHSFTGENVVEFDCHGGYIPLQRVLEIILANGARIAEPGEFSKRAFLNGRIDLAQAEGIMDVINSKTEKSLDVALNQLGGKLSSKVSVIKDDVLRLLAHLEAAIDFPEDEIEGFDSEKLEKRLFSIKKEILVLLESSKQGKIYREGLKTVIVGRPNVGKSSLLNTLLEEQRAIVTDIPGTTRDIIEEYISIKGIPLKIIDTAGIRKTNDQVEKIGVKKARKSLEKADLLLMMLDVSQGLTEGDLYIYDLIKEKPVIIIINKMDLKYNINKDEIKKLKNYFQEHTLLEMSLKEERGLESLKEAIIDEVLHENLKTDNDLFISSLRHKQALENALKAVDRVINSLKRKMPFDFYTIDLKDCLQALGKITGETVTEDILDVIFSDFCLGK